MASAVKVKSGFALAELDLDRRLKDEASYQKKLRRKEMFALLEKLAPTVIAIEACGAKPPLCTAAGIVRAFGEVDRAAPGQAVH